jgi:hypothetical protein
MPKQKPDYDSLVREAVEREKQELENLKASSKPLHELVVPARFTVAEVLGESRTTSFSHFTTSTPMGIRLPVYEGGFTSKLTLKVSPDDPGVPTNTLHFLGSSIVKAGDYISTKIPRYEEKKVQNVFDTKLYGRDIVFYLDRPFNQEEEAIELSIISDGRTLRTDRAINYKKFMEK